MHVIKSFGLFWYDFIVGDDWTVAAAIVVTLAVTGYLAHQHVAVWWLLPLVVIVFLALSLWRAANAEEIPHPLS